MHHAPVFEQKGRRPSQGAKHILVPRVNEPTSHLDLLVFRYENCLDLWSGQPLQGAAKACWDRLQTLVEVLEEDS
jgi:hypothetical protein